MTQEDKKLLLQDLSARLPYGVKCKYNCVVQVETFIAGKYNFIGELNGIVPLYNGHIGFMVDCDKIDALEGDIKPYLRPMSDMTEEEKNEHFGRTMTIDIVQTSKEVIDWLLAHHFDYRGLIEKGLALEALKGMYK
jgi:hypothetical protein